MTKNNVQKSSEIHRDVIFRSEAWSYNYSQDDKDMQIHAVGFGGESIEASVSRNITPPDQLTLLPFKAFSIPLLLYLVQRSSEIHRDVISRPGAWSYNYSQDDKGIVGSEEWID